MKIVGIDVGKEETKYMSIDLRGGHNNDQPVVREVKGDFSEQAQFFTDLIEQQKPLKVVINIRGFGMVLLDKLMGELEKKNIYLDKTGNVAYRD
ncbi:hypothetical protein [Siminovitchia fordii]|uniref:Transposase n=1 Tax=Siminovitchia fordii TaxID=254759 RepID=A0ABQ4K9Z5_9BACI|nr:hypothetical protein [Siminovitchia fordii]GIN22544.1 hypothetical protein J1TS3_36780 [Siminovitchia fordii]